MKNIEKKWTILIVATFVTFFGIGYTLLKGTSAVTEVPTNPAFDDMNFYKCVVDAYNKKNKTDLGYDINLTDEQLQTIINLTCNEKNVVSSSGVEKMTWLESLVIRNNKLTLLDISKNVKLRSLDIENNELTELNVTQNPQLKSLYANNNKLTKLEIIQNSELEYLYAKENQLIELNVTQNPKLMSLDVSNNELTSLDVSQNLKLTFLGVSDNKLTNLNVGQNSKLVILSVFGNQLTELDVSQNLVLESLNASNNTLTELDVSQNLVLETLYVFKNKLMTLDVDQNFELRNLYVYNNELTSLDVSQNSQLERLNVGNNQLSELDVSRNLKLIDLKVRSNKLNKLDISQNLELTNLDIGHNELTSFDASQNLALKDIFIDPNSFSENIYLYVGNNVAVGDNIKIPKHLNWDTPIWKSEDTSIVSVIDDKMISALKVGNVNVEGVVDGKYTTTSTINVVEITSDKYEIDEENADIFVGSYIDVDEIKNNIRKSNDNISVDIDVETYKLYVKHDDLVLKEFDIISYSSDVYDLNKEYIYTGASAINTSAINTINCDILIENNKLLIKHGNKTLDEFYVLSVSFREQKLINKVIVLYNVMDYDTFVDYVSITDGINYKILNGSDEITSGNIDNDMILEIYYNNVKLDSYEIFVYKLNFNDNTTINNENKYIKYLTVGTTVGDFIKDALTTTAVVHVYDSKNNIKNNDDIIKTGDVLKIMIADEVMDEYTLSILGDANGDGKFTGLDLSIMRKHLVSWRNTSTGVIFEVKGVYKEAFDFNQDEKLTGLDLAIMRKKLVGLI